MSEPDTKARVVSKSHHTMSLTTTLHTFLGRKVIRITTMPLFGSTAYLTTYAEARRPGSSVSTAVANSACIPAPTSRVDAASTSPKSPTACSRSPVPTMTARACVGTPPSSSASAP